MWVTPLELCVCAGVLYAATLMPASLLAVIGAIIVVGVLIVIGLIWRAEQKDQKKKQRDAEMENMKAVWEAEYREYLRVNANAAHMPESIDFMHAPKAHGKGRRTVQVLTASYWTLKSRWCKPYAKGAN